MSQVRSDREIELEDENIRLQALLIRALEGIEKWQLWIPDGNVDEAVSEWERDARETLGLNTEAPQ